MKWRSDARNAEQNIAGLGLPCVRGMSLGLIRSQQVVRLRCCLRETRGMRRYCSVRRGDTSGRARRARQRGGSALPTRRSRDPRAAGRLARAREKMRACGGAATLRDTRTRAQDASHAKPAAALRQRWQGASGAVAGRRRGAGRALAERCYRARRRRLGADRLLAECWRSAAGNAAWPLAARPAARELRGAPPEGRAGASMAGHSRVLGALR